LFWAMAGVGPTELTQVPSSHSLNGDATLPREKSVTISEPPGSNVNSCMELTLIDPDGSTVSIGGRARGSFSDPRRSSGYDGKASLFSSCINLANSVLGTGLLALPRAFAHAGFVWGLAFSTLSALLNILTSVYISESCRKTRLPASFTSIADAAYKGYSIIVNLGLILLCLGACCSYIIVATGGFRKVVNPDGASWYWTVLAICIVTPLSFLRSMDALRFTSLAAVIIVLFLTILIVIYSFGVNDSSLLDPCAGVEWNATYFVESGGPCPPGPFSPAGSPWGVLSAFSSLSMAYGAQLSIPSIFNEMENPSPERMLIVYVFGFGFAWVLYGVCAMCGYSTFGDAVTSNILDAYPENGLVSAGRIGLSFVVIFSFPILAMAFRNAGTGLWTVLKSCCSSDEDGDGNTPQPKRGGPFVLELVPTIVTLFVIIVAAIIGFTVTDIGIVADVTGSLGAMTVSFIAPASVYFLLSKDPYVSPMRAASAGVTIFGCVMLVIGLYTAFCGCTERPWARLHPHAHS